MQLLPLHETSSAWSAQSERTRSLLGAEVEAVVLSAGKHALREAWNGNQLVAFATKKGNQRPADEAGGASG